MINLYKSFKRRKLEREGLASPSFRQKSSQTLTYYLNTSKTITTLFFLLLWIFFALVLVFPSIDGQSEFYLVRDQLAPKTVYADFSFSYLDTAETNKQKEKASLSAPLIYHIDDVLSESDIDTIYNFFKNFSDSSDEIKFKELKETYGIDDETALVLTQFKNDEKRLELFRSKLSGIVYKGIISDDDLANIQDPETTYISVINKSRHVRNPLPSVLISNTKDAAKQLAESVSSDYTYKNKEILKKVIYNVSYKLLKPNLIFDESLTDAEKNFISASEKNDVYREIRKGDIIIKKGDKIDGSSLEKFDAYENQRSKRNAYANFFENFSYNLAMSFVLLIITFVYFYNIHKNMSFDNHKIGTAVFVLIVSLLAVFFSLKLFNILSSDFNIPSTLRNCVLPLALAPLLLTALIGIRGAVFASIIISLIAAIKVDSYYALIIGMALGCFSALAVQNSRNYKHFFGKSVITIFLTLVPAELLCFFQPIITNVNTLLLPLFVLCALNALVTGILTLGVLFFIESFFHITTDMSLQALCDYNHPLLKRLQIEAPGTYHHSLIVATLAEHAAIEIKLNPARARACALFHDIGKLSRPEYFTENNPHASELHAALKPGISSMIIMSHVKDGITLALKYKLGSLIMSSIEKHHGTDLVYFFYKKAVEESKNPDSSPVSEKEFRYPGPKPSCKEVSLVSIADSCEAASRSLEKPTAARLETLVWEIIKRKIHEGQLNHSKLSLEELSKIRQCITRTLTSMLHARVSYPTEHKENKDNESLLFKTQKIKTYN
ncbi:MAG TPA: hypothetical protein DD381_14310 [Lentisphaeria bacterium]|nr:MAG: hypothetical protein A2X47_00955 [Lentisphaerae bacterium GWF2_38_69]HBM17498.1 hypothetical protein [Lentisphaeria bacterium]